MKSFKYLAYWWMVVIFGVSSLVSAEATAQEVAQAGWQLIDDSDRIQVYKKEIEGSALIAFKGIGEIDQNMFKVIAAMLGYGPNPRNWADRTTATLLEDVPPFDKVLYLKLNTPIVLKDRDFVVRSTVILDPKKNQIYQLIQSVEHPKAPQDPGTIRGWIGKSSFLLEPLGDGKRTLITVEMFSDPKGSVAKWIVNLVQKSWPRNTINNLREATADPNTIEHAEIKARFKK